jgi:iron complex transport system ATP-binding protein
MDTPIFEFKDLSYTYPTGSQPVMEHFDLQIEAGSITAILGPNGAGKTTLLHLALGWLPPHAGSIHLNGRPLKTYTRRQLGQWIGLVPQNETTAFDFSLLEYVLFGRTPYLPPLAMPGEADVRIAAEKLAEVGLEELKHRPIPSISGGERQLVLLARALTQQPKILLLDEPTSHLDLSNKGRLVNILRELKKQGVTIIFTTHEPDVALAIASNMVLMQKGHILRSGLAEEVMTSDLLSQLYGLPISVKMLEGKRIVDWDTYA